MSLCQPKESVPEYRFLIVEPVETTKTVQCVCETSFEAFVPPSRIPCQITCARCDQRFVLQWIDSRRTRVGSEPPPTTEGHLVAVDADGQFRSVQWTGQVWFAQGKEQQIYRWFELNQPAHSITV